MNHQRSNLVICNSKSAPREYEFVFNTKPFGITFTNKNHDGSMSYTNVFVSDVDKTCAAHAHIVPGSKLIKVQNESVDGLHPSDIMRIVTVKYSKILPLSMTFRRQSASKFATKIKPELPNTIMTNTKSEGEQGPKADCNPRSLFLDLRGFFKTWRTLTSDVLLNTLLICTSDEYQKLIKHSLSKKACKTPRHHHHKKQAKHKKKRHGSDTTLSSVMENDSVFRNLLQWKDEQGLVLIINGLRKGKRSSFWKTFSNKLVSLMDPTTFSTVKYNALELDIGQYKKLDSFKYDVSINDIEHELAAVTLNAAVIQEIMYRSDILLTIYDVNGALVDEDQHKSRSSSLDEEFDAMLNEIASLWNDTDDVSHYKQ